MSSMKHGATRQQLEAALTISEAKNNKYKTLAKDSVALANDVREANKAFNIRIKNIDSEIEAIHKKHRYEVGALKRKITISNKKLNAESTFLSNTRERYNAANRTIKSLNDQADQLEINTSRTLRARNERIVHLNEKCDKSFTAYCSMKADKEAAVKEVTRLSYRTTKLMLARKFFTRLAMVFKPKLIEDWYNATINA